MEDCFAALRWLYAYTDEFSIDGTKIGVLGESAGGGLAAEVAPLARDRQLTPPLAKQILIHPMLDDKKVDAIEGIEKLAIWKSVDNLTSWTALLGDRRGAPEVCPYAAPIRMKDLKGLPFFIEVGELVIFRTEVERYSRRLVKDGAVVDFHLYPGLPRLFNIARCGERHPI